MSDASFESEPRTAFERQLRQLKPAQCDQLLPDTFYRAGWQAALQSKNVRPEDSAVGRRPGRSFASGLLCGLLVSVGLAAWQLSIGDRFGQDGADQVAERALLTTESGTQPADVVQLAEEQNLESVRPDNANRDIPIVARDVDSDSTAHNLGGDEWVDEIPLAIRPLSVVARHQWNQMVRAEPPVATSPSGVEHVSAGNPWPQLRSCPATEAIINSLL